MSSLDGDQIYSGDLSNTPKPYDDVSERTGSRLEKNESLASSSSRNELGGRKDTQGRAEPAEDEGGAARGAGVGGQSHEELKGAESGGKGGSENEEVYPEQLHAGRLEGVGPEYGAMHRVTVGDRIQGLKEELKGSIKHDPQLKQTGKDRISGELKRREREQANSMDPFGTAASKESNGGNNL